MKKIYAIAATALVAGCAGPKLISESDMKCGKQAAHAAFYEDGVKLTLDGKTAKLKNAVSADGAKYEGTLDEKNVVLWNKGKKSTIWVNDKQLPECK